MTELLTPERVAERCEVSPRTVMRAIDAGELRASQLASRGCWRIQLDDVVAWLEFRANRPRELSGRGERPVPAPLAPAPTMPRRGGRSRRRGASGRLHVPPPTRRD